ncbi:MAG: hypothetical protein KAT78_02230 [Flavobacteriaceae bacterium]|nr:hypothetical protein [Flavobacteriaceae bacterium]
MKIQLFFFFIFCVNISFSQEVKIEFITKTPLKADQFVGVDELENIFYIKNNILYKKNDIEVLNYSNVNLGVLTNVNIHNPFKIILFYRDFNAVIILDNKLNELTDKIDFTKETLFNNVQFIGASSENNLWLLANDNKLHLYDFQNHLDKLETQALNFYQKSFIPTSIKSTYKNIWVFSSNGVMQFNEYGSFIKYTQLENYDFISPYENGFIYLNKNDLSYLVDNKIFKIQMELSLPIKSIFINRGVIYTFDGRYIYHYNIL